MTFLAQLTEKVVEEALPACITAGRLFCSSPGSGNAHFRIPLPLRLVTFGTTGIILMQKFDSYLSCQTPGESGVCQLLNRLSDQVEASTLKLTHFDVLEKDATFC